MSEQQGNATNLWGGPQAPQQPSPPPPRDPAHDQTSASERAFAEGWPAQPGWMPEGGVGTGWSTPAQQQSYEQQSYERPAYGQPYEQPQGQTWVPTQMPYASSGPYPAMQDPYPDAGYPSAGGAGYPGPDAPLPKKNTGLIVGSIAGVVLLTGAAVGGVFLFTRDSGGTTPASATAGAPAAGKNTTNGGTGRTQNSTGGTSTGKTNGGSTSSGGTSSGASGKTSTTPPMTSATSIDLTTVHVPAYAASPDADDIAHTLDAYFTGINSGDYQAAWYQFTPSLQAKNPFSQFSDDTGGTIDQDVTVTAVTVNGDGTARTSVTFTSTQPPDKGVVAGQTCTDWAITYSLQLGGGAGGWLISGTPSAQHTAC